jgi:predicted  nucleic acid-binding Zn-ribbon protein
MAKPTVAELEKTIAELSAEINELRDPKQRATEDAVRLLEKEVKMAERGQNAMLQEAKRVSEELTELRTKYVQVPRDLWDMIDQLPNLVQKARQAHPLLVSVNEAVMLSNLKERWSEVQR